MNYQHAYHAGNHTEVFKHSVLCLLLTELQRKATPFAVLDTHAGAGIYDLRSEKAKKTGEATDGIGRIVGKHVPHASAYLDLIRRINSDGLRCYPGSPTIIEHFLRDRDRLIACEYREEDAIRLRQHFKNNRSVSIHHRDGYQAINAFVPLPSKRGLVFIDPPYEQKDEFDRLAKALNVGIKKWPTGIFAAWYPLKDTIGINRLRKKYNAENPPTLCCEFLRERQDGTRLAGSGLIICNPPWKVETKITALCKELSSVFDNFRPTFSIRWWITEQDGRISE